MPQSGWPPSQVVPRIEEPSDLTPGLPNSETADFVLSGMPTGQGLSSRSRELVQIDGGHLDKR